MKEIKKMGFVKTLKTLPNYNGKAYRGDTGFTPRRNATALDVVKFEEDELGNATDFMHLTLDMRKELGRRRAKDVVWMANEKSVAERYGVVDLVYDLGDNPKIIATDGDGGFLVLKDKIECPASQRKYLR
ncbi:hypothetical protein KKG71_03010 [Patescibacteria group bacterium]|nr:hypothetical protein [Patescibacteria group bacterium]